MDETTFSAEDFGRHEISISAGLSDSLFSVYSEDGKENTISGETESGDVNAVECSDCKTCFAHWCRPNASQERADFFFIPGTSSVAGDRMQGKAVVLDSLSPGERVEYNHFLCNGGKYKFALADDGMEFYCEHCAGLASEVALQSCMRAKRFFEQHEDCSEPGNSGRVKETLDNEDGMNGTANGAEHSRNKRTFRHVANAFQRPSKGVKKPAANPSNPLLNLQQEISPEEQIPGFGTDQLANDSALSNSANNADLRQSFSPAKTPEKAPEVTLPPVPQPAAAPQSDQSPEFLSRSGPPAHPTGSGLRVEKIGPVTGTVSGRGKRTKKAPVTSCGSPSRPTRTKQKTTPFIVTMDQHAKTPRSQKKKSMTRYQRLENEVMKLANELKESKREFHEHMKVCLGERAS